MALINNEPKEVLVLGGGRSIGKSYLKLVMLMESLESLKMEDGSTWNWIVKDEASPVVGYDEPENKFFTPKARAMPSGLFAKMLDNIKEN